jgi:hypothetical protein
MREKWKVENVLLVNLEDRLNALVKEGWCFSASNIRLLGTPETEYEAIIICSRMEAENA